MFRMDMGRDNRMAINRFIMIPLNQLINQVMQFRRELLMVRISTSVISSGCQEVKCVKLVIVVAGDNVVVLV
jgi:hypothetical protein